MAILAPVSETAERQIEAGARVLIALLVFDATMVFIHGFALARALGGDHGLDSFRWLDLLGRGALPWSALLATLGVLGLGGLARGAGSPAAKAMFGGAAFLWGLMVFQPLVAALARPGEGSVSDLEWRVFQERLMLAGLLVHRVAEGLLLGGLARLLRGWGRAPGAAWWAALGLWALMSIVVLSRKLGWIEAQTEPGAVLRVQSVFYALIFGQFVAMIAALASCVRQAASSGAARWSLAAGGLRLYRAALLVRLSLLVGTVVVFAGAAALRASPKFALSVALLGLTLGAVAGVGQVVGLARFSAAPAAIARPALWTAVAALGLGLCADGVALGALGSLLWGERSGEPPVSELRALSLGGQIVGVLGAVGLLVSLRRAAQSVEEHTSRETDPLSVRASDVLVLVLGAALLAAAFGYGLESLGEGSPWLLLALALALLVLSVVILIRLLRLLADLAAALQRRAE